MDILETEIAIKKTKDFFEKALAKKLNLLRVSAPLFVLHESGLNDNLSGSEEPIDFLVNNKRLEIVHSLAKWKRLALWKYGFKEGTGLYTDMNAIRKNEVLSSIHSLYVDQWDWEKIIKEKERNSKYLESTVKKIYQAIKETGNFLKKNYPYLNIDLPENIYFITTQELENLYPDFSSKKREKAIVKKHKAVFLKNIGDKLKSGNSHDSRSPDYDDFTLNGDILVWNPIINNAFELSSMGIRVNKEKLIEQLTKNNKLERLNFDYHQLLLANKLPQTIGGGIGQSRLCMFYLNKRHIGEVQASYWPEVILQKCKKEKINLL
ncbi:MAG: aspartate--ammonia ligase [Erysipelotrichales bacterium]|nr:aspartate--ammonia ligase [Erysipelotrichales bacterium]